MSEHTHNAPFPRLPLIAAAALIGTTILLVALVRITGVGAMLTPQATVVAERSLHFQDQDDGGIAVIDADDDRLLEKVAPGSNGFLRGALRGLARERKRQGVGPEPAFRLTGRSDGRLLLQDPSTGRLIDLGSFGPTNAAVFARLLDARPLAEGQAGAAAVARNNGRPS